MIKALVWPHSIAPFDINIIAIGYEKDEKIAEAAHNNLYKELNENGLRCFIR
jgi:prolyl-tRNA synthetase